MTFHVSHENPCAVHDDSCNVVAETETAEKAGFLCESLNNIEEFIIRMYGPGKHHFVLLGGMRGGGKTEGLLASEDHAIDTFSCSTLTPEQIVEQVSRNLEKLATKGIMPGQA